MEDPFLENTMEMNPQENESLLIAGPEDEDFLEDEARIMKNDHGPFSDITLLKQRPAHMAVFLQFVMKQHDPVPLLFFLCDDILKNDQHKSQEIRSLFFNQNAPVRSSFPEEIEMHLRPLSENHSDEDFLSAKEKTLKWATDIVIRQLEDYRKQRVMGLASIYGDHTLTEILQGSTREITVASQLFKNIHNEISNKEEEKSNAVLKAVEGYLKYCGISIEVTGKRRHLLNLKKNFMSRREKEKEKEERKEREKGRQASLLKDVLCPAHRSHLDEGSISNVNHMVKKFEQPMQDTRESRGASNSKLGHNTRLGRSESWKGYSDVHHKVCHPGSPRSMSDVDLSAGRGTIPKQRPSLKFARGAEAAVPTFSDSLFENNANLMVEAEAFDWQASMSRDVLKQLSNQTIKRQDVINELFHTERLHVKSLFVLKVLFRDNLVESGVMEEALVENVFPHLASLLQQHGRINAVMRNMQQPGVIVGFIGDMLVEQFSGENAQQLQQAAAAFCSQQSAALETLKHNQKKDQKFQQFIQAAESSPHCRRLQLKDLLPAEMQRLTKYPLLLKKLAKYSSENAEEQHKVQAATEHCCQILDHVNQSVSEAENAFHLQGYQRKLDLSALQTEKNSPLCQYKNLNLTEHRMLHEGPLTWRLTKEKSIDLQVLLLQDLLVLLQKQEDRLVLRAHSLSTRVPGMSKQVYNPILPLGGLLLRDVARDGKAFFILYLSTNGALMYEFCAGSVSGRKAWWNAINLAQAACNSVSMVTVPTSQRYREGNRAQSPPPRKPVDPDQGTKGITNEEGRCKSDSISASWQQEEIVKAALQSAGHIQVTLKDYFQRSRGKKEEMGTISSPSTPISPTPSTPISTTPSTPISPSPSTPIGLSLPTSIHLSVPQFGGIASNERETQDISTCSQVPVDFLIKNLQVTENEDGEEPKVDERHIDLLAREEDILGELAKLTQLLLTLKTETLPCDV